MDHQSTAAINGRLEAEQLLANRKLGAGPEYNQAFAAKLREFADGVLADIKAPITRPASAESIVRTQPTSGRMVQR